MKLNEINFIFFNLRSRVLMCFNWFICIKIVIGSFYLFVFLVNENLIIYGDFLLLNCFINFVIKM